VTDHTRTTARLATWGLILAVSGIVLAIAAAHNSAYLNAWAASGRQLVRYDEFGGEWPVANWAPGVAVLACVALAAGVWCLVAVVWRIADRVDVGRSDSGHRPGAPLPAATLALKPAPPESAD
jgi:hypothetical protein